MSLLSALNSVAHFVGPAIYNTIKYSPIGGITYAADYGIVHGVLPALEKAGLWNKPADDSKNPPSLRGASNKLAPWGTPPIILGTHYIAPIMLGRPYTEISGTDGIDQYLHVAYLIGYGPLEVRTIKIGDNLLASNSSGAMGALTIDGLGFDGVTAKLQYDSADLDYYPKRVTEDQFDVEMKSPGGTSTMLYRTTAPGCTKIEVDIEFPNGLIKGSGANASVEFKAEYKLSTDSWASPTSITDTTLTKQLKTTGRYTYATGTITAGTYDVRVYRVTADGANGTDARDSCHWIALRSTMTPPPLRAALSAKCVRLSMRVKASDVVNSSLGQVSCVATSKVPIYSGSGTGRAQWTTVAATSNPAALALYILRGDATGDGAGIGPNPYPTLDANIDYPAYEALYNWVAARAGTKPQTCNAVIDSALPRDEIIGKILGTARSVPIKRGAIRSLVLDDVKTTPVALITPRNSMGYSGRKDFPDIPHAYRVGFVNAAVGYQPDLRIALRDNYIYDTDNDGVTRDWLGTSRTAGVGGYILATKLEQIDMWGITDADTVLREARCRLAALTLRPETHTVTQDFQALGYRHGDLVRFGHDVPGFGVWGGRIKTVTLNGAGAATGITTDELITMTSGTYSICYQRASDGRVLYATLSTVAGSAKAASFATPIAAADIPAVDDIYHYGTGTEGGTVPMVIVGLEPGDNHSMTVHMQDYGAGIFSADTGTIPAFVTNITLPVQHDFAGALKLKTQAETAAAQANAAANAVDASKSKHWPSLATAQAGAIVDDTFDEASLTYRCTAALAATYVRLTPKVYADVADATARAALTGMIANDRVYQTDTKQWYKYTTSWVADGAAQTAAGVGAATTADVNTYTPRYLGTFASDPGSPHEGDWYLYNNGVNTRKIRKYSSAAWADVATSDAKYGLYASAALFDLSALSLGATDNTTFTFFANLVANNIFAQAIQLLTGGTIRGGTRYNAAGTDSGSGNGFWLGDSGVLKAAAAILTSLSVTTLTADGGNLWDHEASPLFHIDLDNQLIEIQISGNGTLASPTNGARKITIGIDAGQGPKISFSYHNGSSWSESYYFRYYNGEFKAGTSIVSSMQVDGLLRGQYASAASSTWETLTNASSPCMYIVFLEGIYTSGGTAYKYSAEARVMIRNGAIVAVNIYDEGTTFSLWDVLGLSGGSYIQIKRATSATADRTIANCIRVT